MVYAYDKIAQMPTRDLYDTQLMAMAINAAKDQYDKAEKRLGDLENQLGNFYSPHAKDMQWYKTNVEDRIKNALDDLYSKGIDPLRSAEGRAALRLLERSVPKSTINKMKANAALYEKRRELVDALKAEGKYSLDFDDFMREQNGLGKVEDFSTVGPNGVLNTFEGTPYKYSDASTLYTPYVKDLEKALLTEQLMRDQYPDVAYDPRNDYKARTPEAIRKALREAMPGLAGNPNYEYLRDLARRDLIKQNALMGGAPNYTPTEQEINKRTEDMAYGSVSRFVTQPEAEPNDFKKMEYQYDLMDRNARRAAARTGGGGHGGGKNIKEKPVYNYMKKLTEDYFVKNNGVNSDHVLRTAWVNATNPLTGRTDPNEFVQQLSVDIKDDSETWLGRKPIDANKNVYAYEPQIDKRRMYTSWELMDKAYNIANLSKNGPFDNSAQVTKQASKKQKDEIPSGAEMQPTTRAQCVYENDGMLHWYQEYHITYKKDGKAKTQTLYRDMNAPFYPNGEEAGGQEYEHNNIKSSSDIANRSNYGPVVSDDMSIL